jgi:hypothetical protein
MRSRIVMAILAAGSLSACASSDLGSGNYAFTVQEKYNHLTCKQLEGNIKANNAELVRLQGLSAKAQQSPGGAFVASSAYTPSMTDAHGNLRVLNATYAQKNCEAELKAGR